MQKFSNAARSNLALAINASVTSLAVTTGDGAKFPTLGSGDWFWATLQEGDSLEIVKVTGRSTDTLTVVRGQGGTTGASFTTAAVIGLRPVAADFEQAIGFQTAYNVLSYGADPKGVTNSSAAIQAAIEDAKDAGGGLVHLPAGLYLLTTGLVTYPTVTLQGAGRRATRLLANTASMKMISCTTTTNAGTVVRDMTFLSNAKASVTAIWMQGASKANGDRVANIFLSDLEIFGDGTAQVAVGISLRFCVNVKLTNIWMSLTTAGVISSESADVDMAGVTVQNGSGTGIAIVGDGAAGVGFSHDEGYRLSNCNTNGQTVGLTITGQDWGTASSCSFTTAPGGALIMSGSTTWRFSGCEFSSSTDAAASVSAATFNSVVRQPSGIQFTGCTFSLSDYGLILNGTEHAVSGCTFTANDIHDLALGAFSDAKYCAITGNTFSSSVAYARVSEGSILGTADYNTITGNVMKLGGGSGLIRASGSGANSLYQIPTTPATPLNVFY